MMTVANTVKASYEKTRRFAKRTEIFDVERVDRAMGLILSGELDARVEKYGTTRHDCDCPDTKIRRVYCKHSIGLIILEGAGRLDEEVSDWMGERKTEEIPF